MPIETWLTAFVRGEHFCGLSLTAWQQHMKFLWSLTSTHAPRVQNPPVDWWIFLIREPIAVEGFGGPETVHLAVAHIFSAIPGERVAIHLDAGWLFDRLNRSLADREPTFAAHLAALDRVRAARLMNSHLEAVLERLDVE